MNGKENHRERAVNALNDAKMEMDAQKKIEGPSRSLSVFVLVCVYVCVCV